MTTTDDGRAFWERTAARYDRSMLLLGGRGRGIESERIGDGLHDAREP